MSFFILSIILVAGIFLSKAAKAGFAHRGILDIYRTLFENSSIRELVDGVSGQASQLSLCLAAMEESDRSKNVMPGEHKMTEDPEFCTKLFSRFTKTEGSPITYEIIAATKDLEILRNYRDRSYGFILPIRGQNREVTFVRRSYGEPDKIIIYSKSVRGDVLKSLHCIHEDVKINGIFEMGLDNGHFWFFICPETREWIYLIKPTQASRWMVLQRAAYSQEAWEPISKINEIFGSLPGRQNVK